MDQLLLSTVLRLRAALSTSAASLHRSEAVRRLCCVPEVYGEEMNIEMLDLSSTILEHPKDYLQPRRQELVQFGWYHLKSEESTARPHAFRNVTCFLQNFDVPPKLVVQVDLDFHGPLTRAPLLKHRICLLLVRIAVVCPCLRASPVMAFFMSEGLREHGIHLLSGTSWR